MFLLNRLYIEFILLLLLLFWVNLGLPKLFFFFNFIFWSLEFVTRNIVTVSHCRSTDCLYCYFFSFSFGSKKCKWFFNKYPSLLIYVHLRSLLSLLNINCLVCQKRYKLFNSIIFNPIVMAKYFFLSNCQKDWNILKL